MEKMLILFVLFFFCQLNPCLALNWKNLHGQADKTDLSNALEAVKIRPDSIDDLYILGLVYLNLHKDKDAGGVFNKILSLEPGSLEAEWGGAEVLRRQHKLEESRRLLNEIVKTNPEFMPARISMAYLEYTKMNFKESAVLALKVIRQGKDKADLSNYTRAYLIYAGAKGVLAYFGGPFSKVINGTQVLSNLKKAENLKPDSAEAMLGLGSFYLLAPGFAGRDIDKALDFLKKAIASDPLMPEPYVRLSQVYKLKGEIELYERYLAKALDIDPQNELAADIKKGTCKFICVGK